MTVKSRNKKKEIRRIKRIARKDSSAVCTGECCGSFTLKRNAAEKFATVWREHRDAAVIADMVSYLRPSEEDNHEEYTCKHFKDGRCSIYETRPKMCRDFPYSGICGICGLIGPNVKNPKTADIVWCCTTHMKEKEK